MLQKNMQRTSQDWMYTTQISTSDSISFDWGATVNEWESKFELLRLYKSMNGNTSVPKRHVTKEGLLLSQSIMRVPLLGLLLVYYNMTFDDGI